MDLQHSGITTTVEHPSC